MDPRTGGVSWWAVGLAAFAAFMVGVSIGGVGGFLVSDLGQDLLLSQALQEERADVDGALTWERPTYTFDYPGNWHVAVENEDFDPDGWVPVDSPGGYGPTFILYPIALDPAEAVEDQASYQRDTFGAVEVADFVRWGAYTGRGVSLSRRVGGAKESIRIFAHSSESFSFIVLEFTPEAGADFVQPGNELIEQSFRHFEAPESDDHLPFPIVERSWAPPMNERQAQLIDRGEPLGTLVGGSHFFALDDGRLVSSGSGRLHSLSPEVDEAELVHDSEDWSQAPTAAWIGDRFVVPGPDGNAIVLQGGDDQPAGFEAALLVSAKDDDVVLVRRERRYLPGFPRRGPWGRDELIRRTANGDETLLQVFEDRQVTNLAANGGGTQVLVATTTRGERGEASPPDTELRSFDLASGRDRDHGRWQSVIALASSNDGWLVSGRPLGRGPGVHELTTGGDLSLRISGSNLRGVNADAESITVLAQLRTSDVELPPGLVAYRFSRSDVEELGPPCQPFHAELVDRLATAAAKEIGRPARDRRLLADDTLRERWVAAADRASQRLTSAPLPKTPPEVDRWIGALYGDRLDEPAFLLVTAVLIECLQSEGAEWISSSDPDDLQLGGGSSRLPESVLAMAALPIEAVWSTLYDTEGLWNPASTLLEQAAGRRLLLGLSKDALARAVDEIDPLPALQAIKALDHERLRDLLAGDADNVHLRQQLYAHLAHAERNDLLVELSQPYARAAEPTVDDLRAWLSGSAALGETSGEALAEQLRDAIRAFPDEAVFYLLLGKVHARSQAEGATERARACLKKVEDLYGDPAAQSEAEEMLARLEQ